MVLKSVSEQVALGSKRSEINTSFNVVGATVGEVIGGLGKTTNGLLDKFNQQQEEFVKTKKNGFETIVGERGIQLSGGQRQRIGIARALYKKAEILIFDEATSALDNFTEQAVMDAVNNLNHKITIIIVAHRLSIVKNCDFIYVLDKGKIKAKGSFEMLTKKNKI